MHKIANSSNIKFQRKSQRESPFNAKVFLDTGRPLVTTPSLETVKFVSQVSALNFRCRVGGLLAEGDYIRLEDHQGDEQTKRDDEEPPPQNPS